MINQGLASGTLEQPLFWATLSTSHSLATKTDLQNCLFSPQNAEELLIFQIKTLNSYALGIPLRHQIFLSNAKTETTQFLA